MHQQLPDHIVLPHNPHLPSGPRWSVSLQVSIRNCTEADLHPLEWYGLFWQHREIFRNAFERSLAGENLMLVADMNGFPVGQAWIDLTKKPQTGFIWAVRVFPFLQNHGIGKRLLVEAERRLIGLGFSAAELTVEKHNIDALRLYERMGYQVIDEIREEYEYTTPNGHYEHVSEEAWLLRKELSATGGDGALY